MRAHELSDGTLRYIALAVALFASRLPPVVILNEPESSLHPSLLAPLGQAIIRASEHAQVWIVTHSAPLAEVLRRNDRVPVADVVLERAEDGAARIQRQRPLDRPPWPDP